MKRMLKRQRAEIYYYENNKKIIGVHLAIKGDVSGIKGDVSGIKGDVSDIWGNVSGIKGDVSGIKGDVSGIWGDVSGIKGNVDLCEITEEERKIGIRIEDLIIKEDNA